MKKLKIKNLRSKLVIIGILFIALLYFTNDFTLVDVEKTAIIVAIGVDKDGDEFEVSCQIATPNKQTAGQSEQQVVVTGKGNTISQAINTVHTKTGWYPKLNFCNMIILGDTIINEDAIMPLNYFFRSESFNDSAMVIATPKTAYELLKQNTPLDDLSSYAIQKIVDKSNTKISDVVSVNLKDVMKSYYSKSNSMILPYVDLSPLEKKTEQEEQKKMAGGSQQGQPEEFVYEATQSVIIRNNKYADKVDERMTRIYTLLTDKRAKAFYSVEKTDNNDFTEIAIEEKKIKEQFNIENNHPVYTVNLKIKARILDTAKKDDEIGDLSNNLYIDEDMKKMIEKSMYDDIQKLFDISKNTNADFFKIAPNLYKYKTKQYKQLISSLQDENMYMQNAKINIKIEVKSI